MSRASASMIESPLNLTSTVPRRGSWRHLRSAELRPRSEPSVRYGAETLRYIHAVGLWKSLSTGEFRPLLHGNQKLFQLHVCALKKVTVEALATGHHGSIRKRLCGEAVTGPEISNVWVLGREKNRMPHAPSLSSRADAERTLETFGKCFHPWTQRPSKAIS
jgi:hypothetical protein